MILRAATNTVWVDDGNMEEWGRERRDGGTRDNCLIGGFDVCRLIETKEIPCLASY